MPKVGMEPIRRDQIRKAAAKVIARRGFDRTTLADVAKSAKVSTGMVNHYYKNKTALMVDTLLYASEWFQTAVQGAIDRAETPLDKLRQIFRVGVLDPKGMGFTGSCIWAWAMAEAMHSKELASVIRGRRELFEAMITKVIHELDPGSMDRVLEIRELVSELDAYINGVAVHHVTGAVDLNPVMVEKALVVLTLSRLQVNEALMASLLRELKPVPAVMREEA